MIIAMGSFVMGDFLDNELKNIRVGLSEVEDAKKEADILMMKKII